MTDDIQMKPTTEYEADIKAQLFKRGIDPIEGESPEFKKRVRYLMENKGLDLEQAVESYIAQEGRENLADYNLVRVSARELGMTYKELGEAIGYSGDSLRNTASKKEVSEALSKAIYLYIETIELKRQLKDCNILKQALKNLTKQEV